MRANKQTTRSVRLFRAGTVAAALVLMVGCRHVDTNPVTPVFARVSCQPPASDQLPVPFYQQESDEWCWAAVGQMILGFLGTNVSQCTQVNLSNPPNTIDCCLQPCPTAGVCDHPGVPEFGRYGFTCIVATNAPLAWAEIQTQIHCNQQPIAYGWTRKMGGGHIVAIIGYDDNGGDNQILVNDPSPSICATNSQTPTLKSYKQYYLPGGDRHSWHALDFYQFSRTSGPVQVANPSVPQSPMSGAALPATRPAQASFAIADADRPRIQAAAVKALQGYATGLAPETLRKIGFQSAAELRRATLGQPLLAHEVDLPALRGYTGQGDPTRLLQPLDQVLYPVLVNQQVRALLTLEKNNARWTAVSFGDLAMAQLWVHARETSARASHVDPAQYFAVSIPDLHQYLVGYQAQGKLVLAPVLDTHRLEFRAGTNLEAARVLRALAPAAATIKQEFR